MPIIVCLKTEFFFSYLTSLNEALYIHTVDSGWIIFISPLSHFFQSPLLMAFFRQLQLLLWKNWLTLIRQPVSDSCLILYYISLDLYINDVECFSMFSNSQFEKAVKAVILYPHCYLCPHKQSSGLLHLFISIPLDVC